MSERAVEPGPAKNLGTTPDEAGSGGPDEADSGGTVSSMQKSPKLPLSRSKKVWITLAVLLPAALVALWIAVHSIPWMGPLVANTLRALIGKENVTKLEDFVYSLEDRVNQAVKAGDAPRAYWKVPAKPTPQTTRPEPPPEATSSSVLEKDSSVQETDEAPQEPPLAPFAPQDPGPVHKSWSAEGDGIWVPMVDPRRPEEPPRMFKTLLHADSSRSWSELFVVAVDLRTVSLLPVMGYQEPRTEKKEAEGYQRFAKIPPKHYDALLGAFNGGFMAEHGGYGVYFDGITFLDPKDDACTLAHYRDGSFQIRSWSAIKDEFDDMLWYRQAPNCMYEEGKMHPNLKIHYARKWGATLDGNTVIRRSAVGLSKDREVLYVGISNHTTAKVMAAGMHHAGAENVAQMDVNWSYPKFVTYEADKEGTLHPVALADGFEFSDNLYLRERSMRDFFYLARKEMVEAPKASTAKPSDASALPSPPREQSPSAEQARKPSKAAAAPQDPM